MAGCSVANDLKRLGCSLQIVGVNSRKERVAGQRRIARNSKHRPAMLRRPKLISIPVKLPKPNIGRSGGERHPLFAFLEQIFGA